MHGAPFSRKDRCMNTTSTNNIIIKCTTCGDFRGFVFYRDSNEPVRGYCKCEAEGWEICLKHKGNVRRRWSTTRIYNEIGEFGYLNRISMMIACRENETCFRPSDDLYLQVQKVHNRCYPKSRASIS